MNFFVFFILVVHVADQIINSFDTIRRNRYVTTYFTLHIFSLGGDGINRNKFQKIANKDIIGYFGHNEY